MAIGSQWWLPNIHSSTSIKRGLYFQMNYPAGSHWPPESGRKAAVLCEGLTLKRTDGFSTFLGSQVSYWPTALATHWIFSERQQQERDAMKQHWKVGSWAEVFLGVQAVLQYRTEPAHQPREEASSRWNLGITWSPSYSPTQCPAHRTVSNKLLLRMDR